MLAKEVFTWLEDGRHAAVTSTITMTELLVQPYRVGDQTRIDQFYALLTTYPNLSWVPPSLEIADLAARLRAQHGLRTTDSLQAATAVRSDVTGFITNDSIFRRVKAFDTILMDELIASR